MFLIKVFIIVILSFLGTLFFTLVYTVYSGIFNGHYLFQQTRQ